MLKKRKRQQSLALKDEKFSTKFHAEPTHLRKIQFAIEEDRYPIWTRTPPNLPDDYLKPILRLPDSTAVIKKPLTSEGKGFSYVLDLKGYFTQDDDVKLVI